MCNFTHEHTYAYEKNMTFKRPNLLKFLHTHMHAPNTTGWRPNHHHMVPKAQITAPDTLARVPETHEKKVT